MPLYICLFMIIMFTVYIECKNSTALSTKQTCCTEVMCHSYNHTLTNCTIEDLQTITSVEILNATRVSDELCKPHDVANDTRKQDEGKYGYYKNYIWVDSGCRATFNACGVQVLFSRCIAKKCKSDSFKPNICIVNGMETVTNVTVTKLDSDSTCTLYNGPPVGEYGFNGTYIWVDNGCRANFTVCGYLAYMLSSSTVDFEMSAMEELWTPTSITLVSTVQMLTTKPVSPTVLIRLPKTLSYSLPVTTSVAVSTLQNVLRNKALKQDVVDKGGLNVDTVIGITFGSVAGVTVLGGGIFLLYRSVSRNGISPEYIDE